VVEKRVLIVSPPDSYRIVPYIQAAKALGLEVHLASHGEWAMTSPDARGIDIPFNNPDKAIEVLRDYAVDKCFVAVIGTDDSTLVLAARLALILKLKQNSPDAVNLARRKDLSRQRLAEAGLQIPDFEVVDAKQCEDEWEPACGFPCVVKPLALAGSRGVIRADSVDELAIAIRRTRAIIAVEEHDFEAGHVLVEKYVSGKEYAIEAMLNDGELDVLTFFDKPDPLDGPYFEETYYVMPTLLPHTVQQAVADTVQQACHASGLITGPVHAECRVNGEGVWLIELAARTIGGLCSRLLTFGTGFTLEQLVLANLAGLPLAREGTAGAAGVLMLPIKESGVLRRVEGILEAEKVEFVDEIHITIREGNRVIALPEGSSYLGFVFASAPDPETVEAALRKAHALLNIVIAPYWPVEGEANVVA
jgi:biotin carboxylase